jgi:hypothetical protein
VTTLIHSLERSIGWHLGTALFDALGSFAFVAALIVLAFYIASRIRRRRSR